MSALGHQRDVPLEFRIYRALTFCPFCGKDLEINPIAGTKSCFVHGDFIVRRVGDEVTVVFRLMKWGLP